MASDDRRWEFKVGGPVEAGGGVVGHLRQVVLHPGDGRVTALVVRRASLPPRDVLIPLDAVESADDYSIRLKLRPEEVEALPPLQREQYIAATASAGDYAKGNVLFSLLGGPRGAEQAPEGAAAYRPGSPVATIRVGQHVVAADGDVGDVDAVLVDSASKRVTHFAVRKGLLFSKAVLIPVEWIAEIRNDLITLGVDQAALQRLPTYRPDPELEGDVEDALWDDRLLAEGPLAVSPISVAVRNGVVTLHGHVHWAAHKQRAQEVAAGVRGVLAVQNHLVADDELERAISAALAGDPRTRDLQVRVYSWLGNVHVDGTVPSDEAKAAVEQIAAGVPGVESVVSLLEVEGLPSPWEQDRLRELSTGQPVYVAEMRIGQVEKLLVDPRTWRVTALVVGIKPSAGQAGQPGPREGRDAVVVPIEDVARVTIGGVFLRLTAEEVRRLPRFDPAAYPAPDRDRPPPVPYRREDIVLDVRRAPSVRSRPALTTADSPGPATTQATYGL